MAFKSDREERRRMHKTDTTDPHANAHTVRTDLLRGTARDPQPSSGNGDAAPSDVHFNGPPTY